MVITLDFESSDPGSNPGRTFFFKKKEGKSYFALILATRHRFVVGLFGEGSKALTSDWVAEWSKAPV